MKFFSFFGCDPDVFGCDPDVFAFRRDRWYGRSQAYAPSFYGGNSFFPW
jgi:hypothetical protein